jgi:hypothetical protein
MGFCPMTKTRNWVVWWSADDCTKTIKGVNLFGNIIKYYIKHEKLEKSKKAKIKKVNKNIKTPVKNQ